MWSVPASAVTATVCRRVPASAITATVYRRVPASAVTDLYVIFSSQFVNNSNCGNIIRINRLQLSHARSVWVMSNSNPPSRIPRQCELWVRQFPRHGAKLWAPAAQDPSLLPSQKPGKGRSIAGSELPSALHSLSPYAPLSPTVFSALHTTQSYTLYCPTYHSALLSLAPYTPLSPAVSRALHTTQPYTLYCPTFLSALQSLEP